MSVGSLPIGGRRPPLQKKSLPLGVSAKAWIGRSARGKRGIEWRVAGGGLLLRAQLGGESADRLGKVFVFGAKPLGSGFCRVATVH